MLERLTAFYDSHGVSSVDFRCPSSAVCSAKSPHVTEAKASFVGPRYEERTLPRLLLTQLASLKWYRPPAKGARRRRRLRPHTGDQ